MKILVADDYPRSRKQLARILAEAEHEVHEASDGIQALEAVKELEPDVAFIDWEMPGLSGPDVCRAVRDYEETTLHDTHLILVTARSKKRNLFDGLEAGALDFVLKPYSPDAVASRLHVAEQFMQSRKPSAPSPSAFAADTEPVALLKKEHVIIRKITGILEMVASLLDEGVPIPKKLLEWGATATFLINWELHETKEYAYISVFMERAKSIHGKTSQIFLRSSLTQIMREHEIIKGLLMDMQKAAFEYEIDQRRSVRQLKGDIGKFLGFIRQHASREEDVFFPFSQRYLTDEDIARILESFQHIEDSIGAKKIEARLETIDRLEAILQFKDRGKI